MNCELHQNLDWDYLIYIYSHTSNVETTSKSCVNMAKLITLKCCRFTKNRSKVLGVHGQHSSLACLVSVGIVGPTLISENGDQTFANDYDVFTLTKAKFSLKGTVIMSYNNVKHIIVCNFYLVKRLYSNQMFAKSRDSLCIVYNNRFIVIMEYSTIRFINNTYYGEPIVLHPESIYEFCTFQYFTLKNTSNISKAHFNIILDGNHHINPVHDESLDYIRCDFRLYHFISHCKWIPTSVFMALVPEK